VAAAQLPEVVIKLLRLMAAFANYEGLVVPNITTEFWRAMLDSPLPGGARGAVVVLPEVSILTCQHTTKSTIQNEY